MISMFSSSEADDDLRKLLEENIDWTEEIEFVVSFVKELGTTVLTGLQGLNQRYLGLVESLAPDDATISSKWIYETVSLISHHLR